MTAVNVARFSSLYIFAVSEKVDPMLCCTNGNFFCLFLWCDSIALLVLLSPIIVI